MGNIKEVLISEDKIQNRILELAQAIEKDYDGEILMIGILKGSTIFMADLVRKINKNVYMEFMQVSSYEGTESTGNVNIKKDVEIELVGKDVLIVEDIIDTGNTLGYLIENLKKRGAKSVEIVTLLSKPERRLKEIECKYIGFEIEDKFVVGFGMDYNQNYRNLPYIGIYDNSEENI
ncbi:MAG: hypoxanthine phosphoribosyltransferase [Peptoniphilus sp.]|uniref:hypoxanthine phosphoribosyltransferase n=1 Tax=Peptoniphilus sp. TaxID=1971214 RepID=UPI002A75C2F3|nr:hypoxanthine phosphoribosyltransferase [Peptoniphilus sp.]MDY2986836.1 hypoxanthine phosphoribosyltransferase [Peptoniphilus sp.]